LCYRIIPDEKSLGFVIMSECHNKKKKNIIELLIKYGLALTFEDIKKLLEVEIVIENLERFGIPYDGNLYFWCHIYNFFPEVYMTKFSLDSKILELRNLCRNPKTKKNMLDSFLLKNSLKLDGYCLEMCCRYNKILSEYILYSLKCKPTLNIFYNLFKSDNDDHYELLKHIISNYNVNDTYLSQSVQD
jgi:predicted nucleotidyltransferase